MEAHLQPLVRKPKESHLCFCCEAIWKMMPFTDRFLSAKAKRRICQVCHGKWCSFKTLALNLAISYPTRKLAPSLLANKGTNGRPFTCLINGFAWRSWILFRKATVVIIYERTSVSCRLRRRPTVALAAAYESSLFNFLEYTDPLNDMELILPIKTL